MTKPKAGRPTLLPIEDIIADERLQSRSGGLNDDQVEDIAEIVKKKGAVLPRLSVYHIEQAEEGVEPGMYVTGGFHRRAGYMKAGMLKANVLVYKGTWKDALAAAAKENQEHRGLHRTRADKRRAVLMLIEAEPKMSAREAAETLGVTHTFVNNIKAELRGEPKVETFPPSALVPTSEQPEPEPVDPADEPGGNVSTPSEAPIVPKPGREKEFRWSDAAGLIGSLVKSIDQCATVYSEKKTLAHQGLLRMMTEVEKTFSTWAKDCQRAEAKKRHKP